MAGTTPEDDFNNIEIISTGSLRDGQRLIYRKLMSQDSRMAQIEVNMRWYHKIGVWIGGAFSATAILLLEWVLFNWILV